MNQTLDQRRARHAWEAVQVMKADPGAKDFAREAKKLPTRIMAAGLGQALAFLNSKAKGQEKTSYGRLLSTVADWVLDKRYNPTSSAPSPKPDALIKEIIERDSSFLRRSTAETLAYLEWLTRFADAEGLTGDD